MSSGWSSYEVDSAEARERRRLAEARARRDHLIADLKALSIRRQSLELPTVPFQATDGDSVKVTTQCRQLEDLIRSEERNLEAVLLERQRAFADEQLATALSNVRVDSALAAALVQAQENIRTSQSPASTNTNGARDRLVALAAEVMERQDVADPYLATRVAQALKETPQRAAMLLTALRDEVDRRNADRRATRTRAVEERQRVINAAAEAAAQAEEDVYVQGAIRESLRKLGYQLPDVEAVGAEQAMVVYSAAHPHHAFLASTDGGRIRLDTIRISGPPSQILDRAADQTLCSALAAFRDELEKRGVKTTRVSHLPAGFSPVPIVKLRKRRTSARGAEQLRRQR